MGKFITDRWVCAPHSRPGGMAREPKVSLSVRPGREDMASISSALSSVVVVVVVVVVGEEEEGLAVTTSGRMPDMTPGAKVAWAKTCFIFSFML